MVHETTVNEPCAVCDMMPYEAGVSVALTALRPHAYYALCSYCASDLRSGRRACLQPYEHDPLCDCADGLCLTLSERIAVGRDCAAIIAAAAAA